MRLYLPPLIGAFVFVSLAFGQQRPGGNASPASSAQTSAANSPADYQLLVKQYCVPCHNQTAKIANLLLDKADLTKIPEEAEIWEKVERKLTAGLMPPQGMPRPDKAKLDGLVSLLEAALDRAAAAKPYPGPPLLRRLTRTEYANAVRDLLGLDIDIATMLPADGYSDQGFDNDARALGVAPALMERYLSAAWKISGLAVGSMKTTSSVNLFRPRSDLSQDQHIEGLPVGTRGGILVHFNFPVDGEYILRSKPWQNLVMQVRGLELPTQFEVSLDGARIHLAEFGGPADEAFSFNTHVGAATDIERRLETRIFVKAGPHDVGFAFVKKSSAVSNDLIQPLQRENISGLANTGIPVLAQALIIGPINTVGPGDSPSRRRIFTCRPPDDNRDGGECASKILKPLARLAYRRPATKAEMQELLRFYELGRNQGGGDQGIETAISYMLSTPQFVFRSETDPPNAVSGVSFPVNDYNLATRLSFFIWSSIPDDELLTLAGQGKLRDPAVQSQQVHRMMKDPRSSAFVSNFAEEWLHLRNLRVAIPNDLIFPDFDDNLRQAYLKETELFFDSIIRENRNVIDLLNADYTFVNERLARNYGIPNVVGSQFRRVTVTDENRRGLLGQGSILTLTSYGNRTSPVVRGKYVLSVLLGNPPPPPPPNVPVLSEVVDPDKPLTMRQRMESHRSVQPCAGCHRLMDPIGLALENFDAMGRFRTTDFGVPIDAAGVMADGAKVNGPATLRKAILNRPELFVRALAEALFTYAVGRAPEAYDMPSIRAILRDSARKGNTFTSLVEGVVNSTAFQMKVKEDEDSPESSGLTAAARNAPPKSIATTSQQVQ